ncbi:MAG: hypothetical protein ACI9GZ_003384, partial [Bacteroidia bacterium]
FCYSQKSAYNGKNMALFYSLSINEVQINTWASG